MKDMYELTEYKKMPLDSMYTELWIDGEDKLPQEKSRFNEEYINKTLKDKIGYLNDLKKKFGYSDNLISKLALINLGLLDVYGNDLDDLFYYTLMDTEIILRPGTTRQVNEQLGRGIIPETFSGLYTIDDPLNLFKGTPIINKPLIILGDHDLYGRRLEVELLNSLIHEIRHALTNQYNTDYYINDNIYYRRFGLTEYYYKKGEKNPTIIGDLIDEVFNEYMSEIIVNRILRYKHNNLENINIKNILKKLIVNYQSGRYSSLAYEFERFLCFPLLKNEEILYKANKASIYGEISKLESVFPDYINYCNTLDDLSDKYYEYEDKNKSNNKFEKEIENFKKLTYEISRF